MRELDVLIASDSFKGSASSREIGELLEQGVRQVLPHSIIRTFSIADGGEGTVESLVSALGGVVKQITVSGPLGEPECAHYGLVDQDTAVIETAEASGITLIEQSSDNARRASSLGVGQIILDALDSGSRKILVGLGGLATSDGGAGMAKALGVRFLDAEGELISCGLEGLKFLDSIDCSDIDPRVQETEFIALTDVSNPLSGPRGAVYVYGPQKGIEENELAELDSWMASYGEKLEQISSNQLDGLPGAGAAGGLGVALLAFCGARIESGIEFVLDAIGLESAMQGVDLVITGEGRMDAQSAFGKAPAGVARRAKRHNIAVVAVVGSRADNIGSMYEAGVDLVIPAITEPCTLQECLERVRKSVPLAGETAARAFLLGQDTQWTPPRTMDEDYPQHSVINMRCDDV